MANNLGFQKVMRAFMDGRPMRLKNDETDGSTLRYHGNVILWREGSTYGFTLAGWNTVTTRARVNIFLAYTFGKWRIHQHKFSPLLRHRSGKTIPMDENDEYLLTDLESIEREIVP